MYLWRRCEWIIKNIIIIVLDNDGLTVTVNWWLSRTVNTLSRHGAPVGGFLMPFKCSLKNLLISVWFACSYMTFHVFFVQLIQSKSAISCLANAWPKPKQATAFRLRKTIVVANAIWAELQMHRKTSLLSFTTNNAIRYECWSLAYDCQGGVK